MPQLHPEDVNKIIAGVSANLIEKLGEITSKQNDIRSKSMYTVREATAILDLSEQTIQDHCKNGIIKAVKIGKPWRIPKESITEYQSKNN